MKTKVNQDRHPNFRKDGRLYLVRCFACDEKHGTENYAPAVSSGSCSWCGWTDDDIPDFEDGALDVQEDDEFTKDEQ